MNMSGLVLSQQKYLLDILKKCRREGSKPIEFLIEQNHQLASNKALNIQIPVGIRGLIRWLMYLIISRPNLAYNIGVLREFINLL